MNAPTVAVVIPLGPDLTGFTEQLDALRGQAPQLGAELVLSCNGVDPEAVSTIIAKMPMPGWRVRLVDARERSGPSYARNAGWRSTTADHVLFCDADDLVGEQWVARMSAALSSAPLVASPLELARLNPDSVAAGTTPNRVLDTKFGHLPFAPSCAMGVRRELLEALGGFDEALRCGEDIDLCWRAAYAGSAVELVDDTVVHYRLRGTVCATFRQARAYAEADHVLLERHRAFGAVEPRWGVLREMLAGVKNAIVGVGRRSARLQAGRQFGFVVGTLRGRWRDAR